MAAAGDMRPAADIDAANRGYGGVQDASQIPVSALVDVFGPEAYNVQPDRKRYTKDRRQHIPPNLLGPSEFITERVDGLITDATKSPFTTLILPYQYLEDPDRCMCSPARLFCACTVHRSMLTRRGVQAYRGERVALRRGPRVARAVRVVCAHAQPEQRDLLGVHCPAG